ncbi:hypothetical protein HLB44_25420 [Aquincola sp. S2]|uniref:SF3 helicase domain-containing protein n=1 Tax=Pseudaquabacterium terrae TaxID=2732868 RepID=A0ABX2ENU5_9BURK|nr:phage/plasmid primase, P4 family [Aquabacterium terrae]NRF70354.1 hypothetical protein [Aquabacterium terrae]
MSTANLGPLQPLAAYRQFIVVKLAPKPDGKTLKLPIHYETTRAVDAHDPQNWTDYTTAAAVAGVLGADHCVGFVLTKAANVWCLDIDNCATPSGWSPLANELWQALPGSVIEVSQSGRGLHLWGFGPVPEHSMKNTALSCEMYSDKRFIALGSGAVGEMASSCPGIAAVIARYFQPHAVAGVDVPATGPRADWSGPEGDDELIERAMRSQSARAAFGGGVSFADLWECNEAALAAKWPGTGDAFDRSAADMALFQHLAYYTGCNQGRMRDIAERSAMRRAKWDDRADYLPRTIERACSLQREVYNDGRRAAAPEAAGPEPQAPPVRTTTLSAKDPLNSARAIVDKAYQGPGGYPALRYWQSVFYRWAGAAWEDLPNDDVKAEVYRFIDRHGLTFKPDQSSVAKVVDALKAEVNLTAQHEPPCWIDGSTGPTPLELISVDNGLLHLPTGQLHPPDVRLFTFNAVPCKYDPHAPLPFQWHHFLRSIWPNDPEAISTLQEVFGYLLTADTSQQKIILIVGPKRSGKGTIARVLTELLGKRNVYGLSLSSLSETFGLQPLIGKLAAVVSDARISGRTDQQSVAENLLRISGEDAVGINRKNLPHVSLTLNSRFILLTNELPRIADSSGALASRFVVLTMNESFYGREDRGLTARLLGELPAILNWSLEGWKRLNARGHFAPPRSSEEAASDLADLASPMLAFVRECCTLAPLAEAPLDALYLRFRMWAGDQGMTGMLPTKPVFARDLKSALAGKITRHERRNTAGKKEPFYRGLSVQGCPGVQSIAAT